MKPPTQDALGSVHSVVRPLSSSRRSAGHYENDNKVITEPGLDRFHAAVEAEHALRPRVRAASSSTSRQPCSFSPSAHQQSRHYVYSDEHRITITATTITEGTGVSHHLKWQRRSGRPQLLATTRRSRDVHLLQYSTTRTTQPRV